MIYSGNRLSFLACLLITALLVFKQETVSAHPENDSIPKTTLIINPRINSTGYFPFTGAYINNHINADVNVFYDRRAWGFFIFKSYDFVDPHSIVNYLQPGIFKNINISPKLKVRAFFGYLFGQTNDFKDGDSDYYTAATVYWDITSRVRLEHTALFYDLTISTKMANRLFVSYALKYFKFDLYVWDRYAMESGSNSVSASVAVNFPKIKLSERLLIQNTLSYQSYLTEEKPEWAMRNGFLFQIAFPLTVKP